MTTVYPQSTTIITQPSLRIADPFQGLNGNWNVDLMSCCHDASTCGYACFCWCCFLGSLAGKINESKLSCCCVPNALAVYRMKIRSVLRIRGDSCNDHCVTLCCPICAGIQMRNELRFRSLD